MPLHEDQTAANRHALNSFNTGAKLAGGDAAMDAIIAPLTTVDGYKTAISAIAVHEDQKYALVRINKAADAMKALGLYTDGAGGTIDLANTSAGIRAIHTTAVVPNISATDSTQQGSVLWGE